MVKLAGPYSERYHGMQLRIESKKLSSGKCQVKFYAEGMPGEDLYGYTLVDGERPMAEVVDELKARLGRAGSVNRFYHRNLFSIKRNRVPDQGLVLFRA